MLVGRVRERDPDGKRPNVHDLLADRAAVRVDPDRQKEALLIQREPLATDLKLSCLQSNIIPGAQVVA